MPKNDPGEVFPLVSESTVDEEPFAEVLSGSTDSGVGWVVTAGGDADWFITTLTVSRGQTSLGSAGMAGRKLNADSVAKVYEGRLPGGPQFVMVRTAPQVDRVVGITEVGIEIICTMSGINEEFGLRFGVAALPNDQTLKSLIFSAEGRVVFTSESATSHPPVDGTRRIDGVFYKGPSGPDSSTEL